MRHKIFVKRGGYGVTESYPLGFVLVGAGLLLTFFALPTKDGQAARWLRWDAAVVVFPGCLMVLYALGVAELLSAYFSK
jgi:hypothetical protein